MALFATMLTSCFQIDPINVESPRFNSPVVVVDFDEEGREQLQPSTQVVYELNLEETPNPVFRIPELFDANGHDEDEIYGRFWINHDDTTTRADAILILDRHDDEMHTSTVDKEMCPGGGCWWSAQFTVDEFEWRRNGLDGCHQVMAVFSDSDWEDCPGMQCTEQPTVLARVVWWVWVYDVNPEDSPPPAPDIESCVR